MVGSTARMSYVCSYLETRANCSSAWRLAKTSSSILNSTTAERSTDLPFFMVNTVAERFVREGSQLAAMTNGQVLSKFNCRNVTMRFEWQPLRMHFISHHPEASSTGSCSISLATGRTLQKGRTTKGLKSM